MLPWTAHKSACTGHYHFKKFLVSTFLRLLVICCPTLWQKGHINFHSQHAVILVQIVCEPEATNHSRIAINIFIYRYIYTYMMFSLWVYMYKTYTICIPMYSFYIKWILYSLYVLCLYLCVAIYCLYLSICQSYSIIYRIKINRMANIK